ncbi:MAG: bifunctional UDP-3-O-[3-hydroxymyristoyl] N-acetylglucosamine deacetylase/3-hydroxyacyl-ACP dehydratase [Bacteroidales bacterium]|jgi:UDP-3-O-[3-hydroxymyristoyl] N-acetylglucosamine deacetylase/3-hydroxyacyl-[acyl-carrier-protein] dehydratase|nr:UDP-3-O-[3-hydroxymyristoyl] N-acetylglucosamine deacetylase [Lentimicrobiaceae bacterium]MBT4191505.1 bifunctional UDP-3-O-[3-hydroxymyristoyl] N-acetylglucosamine deacetylase/3-hydroxyacyl-ACP dehydratase [Lentimicrobiaceae bacterium]MDG1135666.1 bifunctional UDP-3-O-[3-hydroxymyristoyl] N-acetylglucosamine deacetylase/3-hydroxyacyl-ACP dehydratase [Bacteroidales bacterium]MDG1901249.1 bifunctional UDP-3-O-[3-hydroxymyristoyl] N-acetylglucosamine deacetylase/3-hydroxyacyl-ACP dehydratase [B|tara:strand:- start:379 stop:1776 length:1398 start_codon:yes stop_codon:yes gene_type:complete
MVDKQKTIDKSITLSGTGLHTGQLGQITLHSAPENHGIKFRRVDIDEKPIIDADINLVVSTARGTTLAKNGYSLYTIEHLLAAFMGLGIDNVMVDVDMEEIPIKDGSSIHFINAIKEAGIVEQKANRKYIEITEPISYKIPDKNIEMLIEPADKFSATVTIDFETEILGKQIATLDDINKFESEIAQCRTFVFLHELEFLLQNNLIKGGDLNNAIVFVNRAVSQEELDNLAELFNKPKVKVKPNGILNNLDMHFSNEPARHKLLDVIGDLALLGMPLKGKITASRPGHQANTEFGQKIFNELNNTHMLKKPPFDIYAEPYYDINQIKKILPHRPPFLLVDKVLVLTDDHIVAMKSVTLNEPFFVGHFPDEPIMPGVLQVEAMAQAGGIFVLNSVDEPELYSTYFLKIEEVRFRSKVGPGDVLIFSIELTGPIKRGICSMIGKAYVGDKVVMEGKLIAQIVKNKEK